MLWYKRERESFPMGELCRLIDTLGVCVAARERERVGAGLVGACFRPVICYSPRTASVLVGPGIYCN